jgi:hypothetical protein
MTRFAAARRMVPRGTKSLTARRAGPQRASTEQRSLAITGWAGFTLVATIAVFTILVAGRSATFFGDDWYYIASRSLGDPATWFPAHNEHWVTLHVIAYRLIYETFGQGSYLPFMLALMATHVAAAAGLYVLARRVSSGWAPLAATSVFLFLGSGYYNLFWGFQFGMVGALALGLWALVALPSRPSIAMVLLVMAAATQGNGLFVAAGAVVYALLVRPRVAPLMVVPFAAFGIWWLAIGHLSRHGPLPSVGELLTFPGSALSAWLGGVAGVGPTIGILLLVAAPFVLYARRAQVGPLTVTAVLTVLAGCVALTLTRAANNLPGAPHYIYLAAPFILLGFVSLRPPRAISLPAFVFALGVNIALVVYWGAAWPASRVDPGGSPPGDPYGFATSHSIVVDRTCPLGACSPAPRLVIHAGRAA